MGKLTIATDGSFGRGYKDFSAMKHGHAVAEAITYLSETVLPAAIANDHDCQSDGAAPSGGFRKPEKGE